MKCDHCCYACNGNGIDMTKETFYQALEFSCNYDSYIAIGGGEPTLHPHFKDFLFDTLGKAESVWLATNGSQTEISITLAKMAQKSVLGCALSLDEWHDTIEDEVIDAFENGSEIKYHYNTNNSYHKYPENDLREIRTVSHLINQGRCDFGDGELDCACSDLFINPQGEIKFCGCDDAPTIGHVSTGIKPEFKDNENIYECYKYNKLEQKELEEKEKIKNKS